MSLWSLLFPSSPLPLFPSSDSGCLRNTSSASSSARFDVPGGLVENFSPIYRRGLSRDCQIVRKGKRKALCYPQKSNGISAPRPSSCPQADTNWRAVLPQRIPPLLCERQPTGARPWARGRFNPVNDLNHPAAISTVILPYIQGSPTTHLQARGRASAF